MSVKAITINGKRWQLRYVPMRKNDGECDPPDKANKEIRIARRLKNYPRTLTETLIHEALHAGCWALAEEVVDQISADITRILDQEGLLHNGDDA